MNEAATLTRPTIGPVFTYRHIVSFEETNVVGNVYYARHVAWQGRCREMFLREHAPSVLADLAGDLRLVTLRVACDYFAELAAFDEVEIGMRLAFEAQHRIGLEFDYRVARGGGRVLAASGQQEIGCMRLGESGLVPVPPPAALSRALAPFRSKAGA